MTESRSYNVGVIGAGVMGRGIAHAVATHGHDVVLVDVSDAILQRAVGEISRAVKAQALMKPGKGASPTEILSRIHHATDLSALQACNVVVENAVEVTETKRRIYDELGRTVRPDTLLAANTSTIPTSEIAGFTSHPERVIGMHFMNPAHTKRVVEVIPGAKTSAEFLASGLAFLEAIGKTGIVVRDAPGFVSNRILMMTINEAIRTVEANIASAEDVDRIFVGCFGHAMGPLQTADLIGLDTILLSLESLLARLHDPKYEPVPLLRQMVAANRLGRKSGAGFFTYTGDR